MLNMIGKICTVVFSGISVIFVFITVIQLTLFLSNFSESVTPKAGNSTSFGDDDIISAATWASIIDISLLIAFVVQHSFTSSALNKVTSYLEINHLQRVIYNVLACLILQVLYFFWHPIPDYELWNVLMDHELVKPTFQVIHGVIWLGFYIMTISFNIPELLGIKSVYSYLFNSSPEYSVKSRYFVRLLKKVKHPGLICFVIILWVYPIMRLDRLILAVILTVYMCLAWDVDENDYNYVLEQRQKKFRS